MSAHNISSNSIRLEWLPPSHKEIHGEFLGYRIRYVPRIPTPAPAFSPNNFSNNAITSAENTFNQNQQHIQQSTTHQVQQPDINGPQAKELIVGDHRETVSGQLA